LATASAPRGLVTAKRKPSFPFLKKITTAQRSGDLPLGSRGGTSLLRTGKGSNGSAKHGPTDLQKIEVSDLSNGSKAPAAKQARLLAEERQKAPQGSIIQTERSQRRESFPRFGSTDETTPKLSSKTTSSENNHKDEASNPELVSRAKQPGSCSAFSNNPSVVAKSRINNGHGSLQGGDRRVQNPPIVGPRPTEANNQRLSLSQVTNSQMSRTSTSQIRRVSSANQQPPVRKQMASGQGGPCVTAATAQNDFSQRNNSDSMQNLGTILPTRIPRQEPGIRTEEHVPSPRNVFGDQEKIFDPRNNTSNKINAEFTEMFDEKNHQRLLEPMKVLCSECFLQNYAETVAMLSSHSQAKFNRGIEVIDCPLVDQCGVDLELAGRSGMVVFPISSFLSEERSKYFIIDTAKLASTTRYRDIFVFLVYDVRVSSTIAQSIFKLQCSILSHGLGASRMKFKSTSPMSLAESIAEVVTGGGLAIEEERLPHNETLIGLLNNEQMVERAIFLLNLLPTLCVHGALECLDLTRSVAKQLRKNDGTAFGLLFTDHRMRQQIMFAATSDTHSSVHPNAMVQFSSLLRAPLASQPESRR